MWSVVGSNFSGMPCLANVALRALITSVAVLFFLNGATSTNRENSQQLEDNQLIVSRTSLFLMLAKVFREKERGA